jgi:hypothetical protein
MKKIVEDNLIIGFLMGASYIFTYLVQVNVLWGVPFFVINFMFYKYIIRPPSDSYSFKIAPSKIISKMIDLVDREQVIKKVKWGQTETSAVQISYDGTQFYFFVHKLGRLRRKKYLIMFVYPMGSSKWYPYGFNYKNVLYGEDKIIITDRWGAFASDFQTDRESLRAFTRHLEELLNQLYIRLA